MGPDDASSTDGGLADTSSDAITTDGDFPDTASDADFVFDGGRSDSGVSDAAIGTDASGLDASGVDGGSDAGGSDAGSDAGGLDASTGSDAGLVSCLSGGTGTHVVRFRWEGTTSGGRATVRLEENTLPDTSRWRANAYSRSIGYTPVWRDPFLGEGGLELGGTVFIDVELSTAGLGSVSNATLAIYGRSYNTTTSGSFEWMTFSGAGASPHGGVSNSAPYEWYGANATTALPAGDDGTLLRIEAGPPSNAGVAADLLTFEGTHLTRRLGDFARSTKIEFHRAIVHTTSAGIDDCPRVPTAVFDFATSSRCPVSGSEPAPPPQPTTNPATTRQRRNIREL